MALPDLSKVLGRMTPGGPPSGGAMKALLVGVGALAVLGAVSLITWQFRQVEAVRGELRHSQQEKADALKQNEDLLREVTNLRADRTGLDEKMKGLGTQLRTSTEELARTRTDLDEFKRRYEELNEARMLLSAQVDSLARERGDALERAKRVEDDKLELERTAARLRERLALLNRDYDKLADRMRQYESVPQQGGYASSGSPALMSMPGPVPVAALSSPADAAAPSMASAASGSGTVELPPIVVRKDQAAMSAPVRGRLVEVNEAHRFVVVDQGSQDGVHVGMEFDIMRGAHKIGRATAVRVRPQLAACDITPSGASGSLQLGDLAVQRAP